MILKLLNRFLSLGGIIASGYFGFTGDYGIAILFAVTGWSIAIRADLAEMRETPPILIQPARHLSRQEP